MKGNDDNGVSFGSRVGLTTTKLVVDSMWNMAATVAAAEKEKEEDDTALFSSTLLLWGI